MATGALTEAHGKASFSGQLAGRIMCFGTEMRPKTSVKGGQSVKT